MFSRQLLHKFILWSLVFALITVFGDHVQGAKEGKDRTKDQTAIDEATLQSHVMSFADRFLSIMASEFPQYIAQEPSKKYRYEVQRLVTWSVTQAYIIAAEDDPGVALLDIITIVMLGRIIFEEEGIKLYDSKVLPIIKGYKMAEKDIMQIAAKVLPADKIKSLRVIIRRWRQDNPEVLFFPLVRFSQFAAGRRESKLTRAEDIDGIFKSIKVATKQAEEARLLAERGIYLATRLPLLLGVYGDLWLARMLDNPDVAKIVADLSQLSDVSARLATAADNLPDKIAKEQKAILQQAIESISKERSSAINQFFSKVSAERKTAIDDFFDEEQRIKGVLSDLRETLEAGNQLIESANTLMAGRSETARQGKPFDIGDYQKTLIELSNSAQELNKLATAVGQISSDIGIDELITKIIKAMNEAESERLVQYATRMILVIIGVWFAAYVIAKLLILFASKKMKASDKSVSS